MRLIYVNHNPMPSSDTESLQVIQTICALAAQVSIRLITARGSADAIDSFYNVNIPNSLTIDFIPQIKVYSGPFRFSWNLPFFFLSLFTILIDVKKNKTDAIVVRNLKLCRFLLKGRKIFTNMPPIIFESHEIFTLSYIDEMDRKGKKSSYKEKRLLNRERYVYENADGLICITNHLANMIQGQFRLNGPLIVAPDGVELTQFNSKHKPISLNQGSRPVKTILYIGSLHHWKGIDILLNAMQYLPDSNLLVIGGEQNSIIRYKTLANELKISKRIRFEGFVTPKNRFHYFHYAEVCVLPLKPFKIASYFTSPIKMFEYMASGIPIVASDLPAIREVLRNNVNSILIPPSDPHALAEGIRCLLDDPDLKMRLANRARQDVEEYTWDRRADKIKGYIERNWG